MEVERSGHQKRFLGGYRHQLTGAEFHHAAVQTLQKKRPDRGVEVFSRDTQVSSPGHPQLRPRWDRLTVCALPDGGAQLSGAAVWRGRLHPGVPAWLLRVLLPGQAGLRGHLPDGGRVPGAPPDRRELLWAFVAKQPGCVTSGRRPPEF